MRCHPSWLLMAGAGMLSSASLFAQPQFFAELIFPLEKWHNHSSSIVEAPNGDLLVCWYHGSGERNADDVVILGSRKPAGSKGWETPFLMADVPGFPDCNPTLFLDARGRLWLFWVVIYSNQWESAILKYRWAEDYTAPGPPQWKWQDVIMLEPLRFEEKFQAAVDRFRPLLVGYPGATEEAERALRLAREKLARRLGWMTRTHPLTLPSGRILLPLYTDAFSVGAVAVSDDTGRTWRASEPIIGLGGIQPSIVRRRDGTLAAYLRDNGPRKRIQYAESHDDGLHWSEVEFLDLPNPGSSVEVVALKSGRWLMVCNDTEQGRHSLAALLSDDEGHSWPWKRHLELVDPGQGSFSYPSIVQSRDGQIHVTYSYHVPEGKSIKHVVFNEEWVMQGDDAK
ncbi:MAG: exo-alpha-sialidase [candidate division KSB1 bacterium]|nr:exo-alpha-sialidase [candidate division KSB1 bacterium]